LRNFYTHVCGILRIGYSSVRYSSRRLYICRNCACACRRILSECDLQEKARRIITW